MLLNNFEDITDIQFVNKTGLDVRFCLSNYQIDLNAVGETRGEVLGNIISLRPDSS